MAGPACTRECRAALQTPGSPQALRDTAAVPRPPQARRPPGLTAMHEEEALPAKVNRPLRSTRETLRPIFGSASLSAIDRAAVSAPARP